jgi:hypothetical protein
MSNSPEQMPAASTPVILYLRYSVKIIAKVWVGDEIKCIKYQNSHRCSIFSKIAKVKARKG